MGSASHKIEAGALAYSYLRFSSPEQARGDSARRQTALRDEWCRTHKIRLSPLSLRDEGVSAFTGSHRENPDRHALAAFLELVRQRRVPKGSYLIIENLDRLTREDTVPALHLFTGILTAGIRIVQLEPEEVYTDRSEFPEVMRAILELSRGHSESRMKSKRVREAWAEKRKGAASRKELMTRTVPGWFTRDDEGKVVIENGKPVLDPERAAVVRRIFRMALDGNGVRAIAKALVQDGVAPIGRTPRWSQSYVRQILTSPAAYGAFVPHERVAKNKRKAAGQPIAGYYPAAVSEKEYLAAQGVLRSRNGGGGRPASGPINLFTGLVRDAADHAPMHLITLPSSGGRIPYLVNEQRALKGGGSRFAMAPFEAAILQCLREVDRRELLSNDRTGEEQLALSGRRGRLESRIKKLTAVLGDTEGDQEDTASLQDVVETVRRLRAELNEVNQKLARVQQQAASPLGEAWGDYASLYDAYQGVPEEEKPALRLRLRSILRRIVSGIWCLSACDPPDGHGPRRLWVMVAQIFFSAAGSRPRTYLIRYEPPRGNPRTRRQADDANAPRHRVTALGSADRADLRKPKDRSTAARLLARALQEDPN
jgi:DNA invertase Pin-like site-specific DNA recombinase